MYDGHGGPGESSVPILYRHDLFDLVAAESVLAVPSKRVVRLGRRTRGSGPARIKTKVINRVTLRHRATGVDLDVLNTHFLPSWTGSKERLGLAEYEARREHGVRHRRACETTIAACEGVAVLCGDFNAPDDFDLLAPLWTVVDPGETPGTHGNRRIDYAAVSRSERVASTERRVLDGYSSDHRPVVGTITTKETP